MITMVSGYSSISIGMEKVRMEDRPLFANAIDTTVLMTTNIL